MNPATDFNLQKKKGQELHEKTDVVKLVEMLIQMSNANLKKAALEKERTVPVNNAELLKIFAEYFAPNTDFFSLPGSEKHNAYFNAINNAKSEIMKYSSLFEDATRRTKEELVEMVNNPKAGITNMLICGLIFCMGDYAVISSCFLCVDFADQIPYCISIYFFSFTKATKRKRTQILDAGDVIDHNPLRNALDSLKVCDKNWNCRIL